MNKLNRCQPSAVDSMYRCAGSSVNRRGLTAGENMIRCSQSGEVL